MSDVRVDEVVIVDWSASASPKLGKDSIWLAHVDAGAPPSLRALKNLATRAEAVSWLLAAFGEAKQRGRHLVCGFDFSFGYPAGYSELLRRAFAKEASGKTPFERVLSVTSALIRDSSSNDNNRFEVAALINWRTKCALFWGRPPKRSYESLSPTKALPEGLSVNPLAPLRHTERSLAVKTNWQLAGAGAVGSQVLMGLPVLDQLWRSVTAPSLWPFEPHGLAADGGAVMLAEVWPTMFTKGNKEGVIRDSWQVESTAIALGSLHSSQWSELLAPKAWEELSPSEHDEVLGEEGWILGKT